MKEDFRKKLVYGGIRESYNDIVGEIINTTYDYEKDTEEYKEAIDLINDNENLCKTIYNMLITEYTMVQTPIGLIEIKKDIRFLGKETIIEMIKKYIAKHIEEDIKELN